VIFQICHHDFHIALNIGLRGFNSRFNFRVEMEKKQMESLFPVSRKMMDVLQKLAGCQKQKWSVLPEKN